MSDRMLTMAEAVREAMTIAMEERPDVFLMGEDVGIYGGAFGVSSGMRDKFGAERIIDTPISELGIVGEGKLLKSTWKSLVSVERYFIAPDLKSIDL